MECKDRDGQKIYTTDVVLIETYWNVKIINRENVITDEQRINRNILECKVCILPDLTIYGTDCINRNILECKERYILHILDKFLVVLIETYWNVKKYTQTADLGYIPY